MCEYESNEKEQESERVRNIKKMLFFQGLGFFF